MHFIHVNIFQSLSLNDLFILLDIITHIAISEQTNNKSVWDRDK
jgi:hypothetical protein